MKREISNDQNKICSTAMFFSFIYSSVHFIQSLYLFSYLLWEISMGGSPGDVSEEPAHSPTVLSLHLRHNSFANPSVALPTSQLILQRFRCFTYITAHFPTLLSLLLHHRQSRAHSPTVPSLHLRHNSFSNPSFASPTSQALQLRHLASRPRFRNSGCLINFCYCCSYYK